MPRKRDGERILGPYENRDRGRWGVVEIAADGSRAWSYFASQAKAEQYIELLRAQVAAPDLDTDAALERYLEHLKLAKGNKDGSNETTRWAVKRFFPEPLPLWSLRPTQCAERYRQLATSGELAVDSHRNMLAQVRTYLDFCVAEKWLAANPLADVKGQGRRNKRKAQLRIREARAWFALALARAQSDKDDADGALAALIALLLGMRASEIVALRVRDLDEDEAPFDSLWIDDAKTPAGRRQLDVPDVLRPLLAEQVRGRTPDALLFPVRLSKAARLRGERERPHWRDWPRENVQRICKDAGVPVVTAHGMRGLLSTISLERGLAGHLVAATLGHEDVRTTMDSYAQPGAAEKGARRRGLAKVIRFPGQDPDGQSESGSGKK